MILELDQFFITKAACRKGLGDLLDYNGDRIPIIMAYVDNVNCLLPLEDVEEFIQMFCAIGKS